MITRIKIDTEAIKRNGALPKDGTAEHEPAIMVIEYDDEDNIVSEQLTSYVSLPCHSVLVQNDSRPGAISKDGRAARVWIETTEEVFLS